MLKFFKSIYTAIYSHDEIYSVQFDMLNLSNACSPHIQFFNLLIQELIK